MDELILTAIVIASTIILVVLGLYLLKKFFRN
mgnify:CR=1 FL=1